jgi:sarcosine oxidase subunit gamma
MSILPERGSMPDIRIMRRFPVATVQLITRDSAVTIAGAGPAARFVLRGGEAVAQEAGASLDIDLALPACRSVRRDGLTALWLGPDEWLLLGRVDEESNLAQRLTVALASLPHSLVSIGHRDVAFMVRGRGAANAINAGCPLDLRISAFPVGACSRTLLGKAEIILWRTDTDAFRIEAARSFAAYVQGFLELAACDADRPRV